MTVRAGGSQNIPRREKKMQGSIRLPEEKSGKDQRSGDAG
ncbi:MAG: hypothetical protein A4E36_01460 [Methanoregulaceae archaeon PtaB.Bin009]|nr:MAG: hypothetical protein A4E36_01460 [Methanoregulaceae archaeon PtaB.Bin009]OPY41709.1 MAG: hypothetical protein A4E41_00795 [Methanoregulaceae archaeon PtaU1.Bin066]